MSIPSMVGERLIYKQCMHTGFLCTLFTSSVFSVVIYSLFAIH